MKAIVLLNAKAGSLLGSTSDSFVQSVQGALAAAGIDAQIRTVRHDELSRAAKAAAQSFVDVVIGGGGDGTISTIAAALADTDTPLGILPLGTLNHFAKDLGVPLDLVSAAQAIASGQTVAVDLGRVNDAIFINNSSLGLYPRVVQGRESLRNRFRLGKWFAMLIAIFKVFRRFPLVQVRLQTEAGAVERRTPLVFVGNNTYQLDLLNIGKRACVNEGCLSLYVANTQNRWGVFKMSLRAMLGRLRQTRDFEQVCLSEFTIVSRRKRLYVGLDGEVVKLRPPLHYRTWPGALKVRVPTLAASAIARQADAGCDAEGVCDLQEKNARTATTPKPAAQAAK